MSTPRSPLMDALYGIDVSIDVYKNLQDLDHDLNKEVQEIAYEHYWARPGLSTRDKSLITVVSLISSGKEKQTKPHMLGFLNTGGTKEELITVLIFLQKKIGKNPIEKAVITLHDLLSERNEDNFTIDEIMEKLSESYKDEQHDYSRDLHIANVASAAAIGKQEKTQESIKLFLASPLCNIDDIRNTLIHQIAYCGFPVAVNGFGALKSVMKE